MKWAVVMVDDVLRVKRSSQRTTVSLIDTVLSHRPAGHAGWLECMLAGEYVSPRPQGAQKPSRVQMELLELQGEGRYGVVQRTNRAGKWLPRPGGRSPFVSSYLFLDVEARLSGLGHDLGEVELV